ncbi:MAG: hypothetical protein ACREL7_16385 [Longimicrobiales bacterium]
MTNRKPLRRRRAQRSLRASPRIRALRFRPATTLTTVAAILLGGCDLDVENPAVIDAAEFDPAADAASLSFSAQTNFYDAFAGVINYGAYFSGELWVAAVRQETNDFGRRVISSGNLDLNPQVWAPLSLAIASNERVLEVLDGVADAGSNLNIARSAMNAGFAIELMAEYFCQGVMLVGPPMTPEETLDSATVRFERAITVASAASGEEATSIANASRVGLARAYLQKGDYANAAQAAMAVPDDFLLNAVYVDDLANRGRVSNGVFASTVGNIQVVPADYLALADPRVPSADRGRLAQDGQLQLIVQTKYESYGDPIRVASGLEARYIAAEANLQLGNTADALALIAERRAANGQNDFNGSGTPAILADLMDQRTRDFWLEGKHLGDFFRNPGATPYVPTAGTPFYKPTQGVFAEAECLPVPNEERRANPHFS